MLVQVRLGLPVKTFGTQHGLQLCAGTYKEHLPGIKKPLRVRKKIHKPQSAWLETDTMSAALEQESCIHATADDALHAFVRRVTFVDMHREPGPQLASVIFETFGLEGVAVFDADVKKVYCAGEWRLDPDNFVRNIYVFETASDEPRLGLCRRVVRVGSFPVGALLLRGEMPSRTADSIAALCGLTFDRYHSYANVGRTESARQTEQLRTTVLDSLAHAYKTPLTAIQAASSGLVAMGGLSDAQRSLVDLIEQQARVLNELTTRLLKTARLEAQDISLHRERVSVAQILEDAVALCREQLSNFAVDVQVPDELEVLCDRELVTSMLTQYVDNAAKYGSAGTSILVEAAQRKSELVFSVTNSGTQIAPADQERIFDLYFRCADAASATSGTGVGLSIAKRAAQAHGGDVWVISNPEGRTTFCASLPISDNGGD